MKKATIRKLHQRAGGGCEPVQCKIFPLSEPVVKPRGRTPYRTDERSGRDRMYVPDNMGGNAEAFDECKDKPFVPCVDRTQGRKAFVLVEGEKGEQT